MRAVRFREHGGESVLQVDEVDRPEPAPDEVLAEVAAQGCRVVAIGENDPQIGFPQSSAAHEEDLNLQLMSVFNTPSLADALADIASLWGEDITIEVAHRYDLEGAAEGQTAVMEDSFLGKLVIEP
jgi:NADPH:quinone reductase-like Zn-dependent oxidoreductase